MANETEHLTLIFVRIELCNLQKRLAVIVQMPKAHCLQLFRTLSVAVCKTRRRDRKTYRKLERNIQMPKVSYLQAFRTLSAARRRDTSARK